MKWQKCSEFLVKSNELLRENSSEYSYELLRESSSEYSNELHRESSSKYSNELLLKRE